MDEVEEFLTGSRHTPEPDRGLLPFCCIGHRRLDKDERRQLGIGLGVTCSIDTMRSYGERFCAIVVVK